MLLDVLRTILFAKQVELVIKLPNLLIPNKKLSTAATGYKAAHSCPKQIARSSFRPITMRVKIWLTKMEPRFENFNFESVSSIESSAVFWPTIVLDTNESC